MPDLSIRSLLPEVMDQEDASGDETRLALTDIGFINKWLGGYAVILDALDKIQWPDRTLTIVDLGSGGGDTLRAISNWAKKKNKLVKLIGVDRNPVMTDFAVGLSKSFSNIEFVTMDVFDPRLADVKADIAMNSLFCHHFDNDDLVKLIQAMRNMASQAVIINDIDRHWFAYHSIKMLTSLFAKTDMVKYDAPLSVARSLTKREWQEILQRAGAQNYSLRWMWAWRWQIIIPKNA
jgi:hypothetical protein